jgi:hypothetical protein
MVRGEEVTRPDVSPLITIVTPSYNQGAFIGQTIESVLGQDYPFIEYLVIDGGSSDETLAVLRRYETDPRLHWVSEPDRGQSDAINKGLARATGDLFTWLNADDLLTPGALQHLSEAWRPQEPAVLYGIARFIDERGRDLGPLPGQTLHITLAQILQPTRHSLPQPATFAPTALVRELGGVDESLHYTMDLDLWVRLGQHIPFRFVPHNLALFRLHASSKTVSFGVKFVQDVERVMARATRAGLMTARQAQAQVDLFALSAHLTSRSHNYTAVARHFIRASLQDRRVIPEALLLLGKGGARTVLGERLWMLLRRQRTEVKA